MSPLVNKTMAKPTPAQMITFLARAALAGSPAEVMNIKAPITIIKGATIIAI